MTDVALLVLAVSFLIAVVIGGVAILVGTITSTQRVMQSEGIDVLASAMRDVIQATSTSGTEAMVQAARAMQEAVAETYPKPTVLAELKGYGDLPERDGPVFGKLTNLDDSDPFDHVEDPRAAFLRQMVEPVIRGAQSAGLSLSPEEAAVWLPQTDDAGPQMGYEQALADVEAAGPLDAALDRNPYGTENPVFHGGPFTNGHGAR